MNVQEMTFGVELETVMPLGSVRAGGHGRGVQVPWLPTGWLADNDPSVRSDTSGLSGVEFVSPVLKGMDGIRQLCETVDAIKQRGGSVNSSCGLHVHVGFRKDDRPALERLVSAVANFEQAIYSQTGTKSRENGRWCRSLADAGGLRGAIARGRNSRYHVLNIISGKPTVEFRAFAGTLSKQKILGHVLTCLGLVEKSQAKPKKTQFKAKTPKESSPIHRGGVGQTTLCRMFYFLGWTKGRESRVWGNLFPTEDAALSVKGIKKTLMAEAKLFDEGQTSTAEQNTRPVVTSYQGRTTYRYQRRRWLQDLVDLRMFDGVPSTRPATTENAAAPATENQPAPRPGALSDQMPEAMRQMLGAVAPQNQNETPE